MNERMKTTLRAWPVITAATIGLCFATQTVAKLFGIDLPDQDQVEFVRRYAGWNLTFAFIVMQVAVLVPVIEELLFRCALWKAPLMAFGHWDKGGQAPRAALAVAVSALFSFAHYVDYPMLAASPSKFALTGWNCAFIALFFFGLAQCWLYRRGGALWCAMLNHMLFNLTNLVLLLALPR